MKDEQARSGEAPAAYRGSSTSSLGKAAVLSSMWLAWALVGVYAVSRAGDHVVGVVCMLALLGAGFGYVTEDVL